MFAGAVAAVSAIAAEPVTLRFTVWDGDESLKVIRRVLKQFEQENPDVRVKLENFPDYAGYHQKMLTMFAANTAPDVAMMDMGHFQALANRGALQDLNEFIRKTPGFDINTYYKPIVEAHSKDGKLYVLPRDIAPSGLIYYNKKAFDEAGIPYPDGSWTWDFQERPELKEKDFLWVMHKLTKPGPNGKPSRYGYVSGWPGLFADTLMYSYGLQPADDNKNPTKVLYNSPEMKKVYDLFVDLTLEKKWIPSNTEVSNVLQQSTTTLFIKEKVAMFQNGIWEVPNIRRDMKPGSKDFFEWDIALFPAFKNGHRGTATGGSGYAVFSSTQYPEQAWRLTKYMAGPVGMKAMAEAGIAQPAIRSLALSDAWLPGPNTPKEQQYPKSRIVTDQAVPHVNFGPTGEFWPEVQGFIDSRRDSIYNGIMKPTEALDTGVKEAQARLDALRKEETLPLFNWTYGILLGLGIVGAVATAIYWPERGIKYTLRQKRENAAAYRFLSPWLIGLCVFTLGPMILSLIMSFLNWDMIRPAQWRGTRNYTEALFDDPRFWTSLKVTATYTLLATPLGVLLALSLALLLNQKVKGVPLFRAMFYIPSIASAVAMTLVTRKIMSPDSGLLNMVLYHPALNNQFVGRFLVLLWAMVKFAALSFIAYAILRKLLGKVTYGAQIAVTAVPVAYLAFKFLGDLFHVVTGPASSFLTGNMLNTWSVTKPGDYVNWLGNEHTAMPALILLSFAGVGGGMIVMLAGLQGIPQYYYEAATVDGAGPLHRLKAITLPLLTPSIFFSLITGFIGSFQVFTQVFIITGGANGGPNNSMLVYMISLWSNAFNTLRMGYAASLAWVLFLIIMLFTLLQMKGSKWVYYEADVK